jgi:hypothetical protein
VTFFLQPAPLYFVDLRFDYNTFSDHNHQWMITFAPHTSVIRSQFLDMEMGLYVNGYRFAESLSDGYYSPTSYQFYGGTLTATLRPQENISYVLGLVSGLQRDNTMTDFNYDGSAYLQANFTFCETYLLSLYAYALVSNGSESQFRNNRYREYNFYAILTKRF